MFSACFSIFRIVHSRMLPGLIRSHGGNDMNHDLIRIAIVLDRSGSMASIQEPTITGFNEFIGSLRAAPGNIMLKLVQFDDQYETVFDLPLHQVPPLTFETFVPRGMTALLDAQGRTIVELGQELNHLPASERPGKVIVMTMTDGMENASQLYTDVQVAAMVEHQREVYKWQFLYLGANQDAIRVAAGIGIPQAGAITYFANRRAVANTLRACASNIMVDLCSLRPSCEISFSLEDRAAAMAEAGDQEGAP